jgi:hypothetical protein
MLLILYALCTLFTLCTRCAGAGVFVLVQPIFCYYILRAYSYSRYHKGSRCTLVLQDILVKMFNSYLEGTPYAIVAQQLGNNLLNNDQVRNMNIKTTGFPLFLRTHLRQLYLHVQIKKRV